MLFEAILSQYLTWTSLFVLNGWKENYRLQVLLALASCNLSKYVFYGRVSMFKSACLNLVKGYGTKKY